MSTTYYGADVSTYQGTITWSTYAANKSFVIIKAGGCDAGYYQDSEFSANQTGARAQSGLRIGYYYFGDRNADATTAANAFIGILGSLNSGEILALDIEGANYPQDSWAYIFSEVLSGFYGFYPFVYMSWQSPTSSSLSWPLTNGVDPFWMAATGLTATDWTETTFNADSPWGGLPAPNYRIHQYSSGGSIPGISGAVDLDSFYSPNNTLADWNALGYQGAITPTHGIWVQNASFNVTPTFTQPLQQTISVPQNNYDKVIFSTTWSDTVTSNSWPVNRVGPTTITNQTCYPVGNYTFTLNGVDFTGWNDFSFIYGGADLGTYQGNIPPIVIQPIVSDTGVLSFDVSVTTGSGTQTVDYTVNVALLLSYSPSSMPVPTLGQTISQANLVPNIMPAYGAYRRIAIDSVVSGTGAHTIAHDQLSIPNVIAFPQDSTGDCFINATAWTNSGAVTTSFGLSMDANYLYFNIDTNLTGAFYRVYSDN
jgi:GH25 family lysozyme M1 (1,4-beta-N-acetylmuramidase)